MRCIICLSEKLLSTFYFLTFLILKMVIFWVVAMSTHRPDDGIGNTSETSINFYQTIRRNNSEDSRLHTRRRKNHKSHCPHSVQAFVSYLIVAVWPRWATFHSSAFLFIIYVFLCTWDAILACNDRVCSPWYLTVGVGSGVCSYVSSASWAVCG
jgi:hypothetical protein